MKYRTTTSASNWVDLWLNKFAAELAEKKIPETEAHAYLAIVKSYLGENPGNPREIGTEKLEKFVSGHKQDAIAPLALFYGAIAPSENHLKALEEMKKEGGRG